MERRTPSDALEHIRDMFNPLHLIQTHVILRLSGRLLRGLCFIQSCVREQILTGQTQSFMMLMEKGRNILTILYDQSNLRFKNKDCLFTQTSYFCPYLSNAHTCSKSEICIINQVFIQILFSTKRICVEKLQPVSIQLADKMVCVKKLIVA